MGKEDDMNITRKVKKERRDNEKNEKRKKMKKPKQKLKRQRPAKRNVALKPGCDSPSDHH